jgi:hypothetical protein
VASQPVEAPASAEPPIECGSKPECHDEGRCHYSQTWGVCAPESDADCKASTGCKQLGRCFMLLVCPPGDPCGDLDDDAGPRCVTTAEVRR